MRDRWKRLRSELIYDAGILRLRRDEYEHRGRLTHPFFVLESRPWINVVALTQGGEILLVRQFRHGIEEVTVEVPGGVVDEEDESPAAAATRELLEETGHRGSKPALLASVSCNPAILCNRTYSFVIREARKVADLDLDENEDLEVFAAPVAAIPEMLKSGEIHHALSVSALSLFLLSERA